MQTYIIVIITIFVLTGLAVGIYFATKKNNNNTSSSGGDNSGYAWDPKLTQSCISKIPVNQTFCDAVYSAYSSGNINTVINAGGITGSGNLVTDLQNCTLFNNTKSKTCSEPNASVNFCDSLDSFQVLQPNNKDFFNCIQTNLKCNSSTGSAEVCKN